MHFTLVILFSGVKNVVVSILREIGGVEVLSKSFLVEVGSSAWVVSNIIGIVVFETAITTFLSVVSEVVFWTGSLVGGLPFLSTIEKF